MRSRKKGRRSCSPLTFTSLLLFVTPLASGTAFAQKKALTTPLSLHYTVETVEDIASVREALFPNAALRTKLRSLSPNATPPLTGDNTILRKGGNGKVVVGASFVEAQGQAAVFLPGEGQIKALRYHPVVWEREGTSGPPTVLPLPPDCNRGVAVAINTSGQIIGQVGNLVIQSTPSWKNGRVIAYGSVGRAGQGTQYPCDTNPRSILWTPDGRILPIPCLSGDLRCRADDINTQGEIVGGSYRSDLKGFRAVLWRHGDPIDLNRCVTLETGESLYEALYLNDEGQILAACTRNALFTRYVLLTPKNPKTK